MSFERKKGKGRVQAKAGTFKSNSGKPLNSLADALAEEAKCGNCGCDDCPCPHYVLGSLDQDPDTKIYLWNDAGAFTTGTEEEFKVACEAALSAE